MNHDPTFWRPSAPSSFSPSLLFFWFLFSPLQLNLRRGVSADIFSLKTRTRRCLSACWCLFVCFCLPTCLLMSVRARARACGCASSWRGSCAMAAPLRMLRCLRRRPLRCRLTSPRTSPPHHHHHPPSSPARGKLSPRGHLRPVTLINWADRASRDCQ